MPEIKEAISKYLTNNENSVLICDNAHRYPVKLRYWLEEVVKKDSVLMFATHQTRKEIFLLIPRIEMKSLQTSDMRSLMLEEASNLGVKVDTSKLAELEERAVGSPHLAKRVIQEEALGLAQEEAGDHVNYIDGTPFFIAALSLVAIARFIGLGMGDKGLYIVGGIAMVLTITLRVFFTAINRKSSKL